MKYADMISPKATWRRTKKFLVAMAVVPSLVVSGFGASIVPVALAVEGPSCDSITLVSGEGSMTAGYTTTEPSDELNPASYEGSFSGADETTTVIPPWVDPATEADLSGAEWISTDSSNNEGNAADDQWRLFEHAFTLPAGAVVSSADLWYTADNAVSVYLNGSEIDSTGDVFGAEPSDPQPLNFSEVFDTSLDPEVGENTLDFVVRNWAHDSDNPTGLIYRAVIDYCVEPAAENVTVTIAKYIDGEPATAETADNSDFPMSATWSDLAEGGIGAGTGEYALSETGFNNPNPYQATTADMQPGADYSTNEILTGDVVGATCEDGKPFALLGYTSGDTMEEAQSGDPSLTPPSFTDIQSDKYVIVWNDDCATAPPDDEITVTIHKFIQGEHATADSADNAEFPMSATWNEVGEGGIGAGTGPYTLGPSNPVPYEAETIDLNPGSSYSTSETLTGPVVAATCEGDEPFALQGYTTGDTLAEAMSETPSLVIPSFTNLQEDKHVIVWNRDCALSEGEIGGEVGEDGVLEVTSIDNVDTSATADGTFESGWEYLFHITTPTSEENLQMKFSDWQRSGGGGTIPVANNMRISSAQANNGGATILLTAADTYSTPPLVMVTDLNPAMAGRQVEVKVEVAVPVGTPDGSYTTNYGVRTTP